jgi:hypothetical protein
MTQEPTPLCACGCGQHVSSARRRYINHHAPISDEGKARLRELRRKGSWRTCPYPGCGKRQWIQPARMQTWRACSRAHAAVLQRQVQSWNALQVECLRWISEHNSTLAGIERELGTGVNTLRTWFNNKGAALRVQTIERLAMLLGMTTEQATAAAGGITAEDKRAKDAAAKSRARSLEQHQEAGRRGGSAGKGKKHSAEWIANQQAALVRTGARERCTAAIVAASRSDKGRALRSLTGRLRRESHPSAQHMRAWAENSATRFGLDIDFIMLVWKPYLEARGAWPLDRKGRPPIKERCLQLRQLMADWPWTGEGRAPKGFDPAFGALIGLNYSAARMWRRDHHPCELACPKARQGVKKQSR